MTSDKQIFPFFDLPAELTAMILTDYFNSEATLQPVVDDNNTMAHILGMKSLPLSSTNAKPMPTPPLLLVNSKMHNEAKAIRLRAVTVIINLNQRSIRPLFAQNIRKQPKLRNVMAFRRLTIEVTPFQTVDIEAIKLVRTIELAIENHKIRIDAGKWRSVPEAEGRVEHGHGGCSSSMNTIFNHSDFCHVKLMRRNLCFDRRA